MFYPATVGSCLYQDIDLLILLSGTGNTQGKIRKGRYIPLFRRDQRVLINNVMTDQILPSNSFAGESIGRSLHPKTTAKRRGAIVTVVTLASLAASCEDLFMTFDIYNK